MKLFRRGLTLRKKNLWALHHKSRLSAHDAAMLNFEMAEDKIEESKGNEIPVNPSKETSNSIVVVGESEVEYQMDNFIFRENIRKTEVQERPALSSVDVDSSLRNSGWTEKQIRELKVAKIYLEEII